MALVCRNWYACVNVSHLWRNMLRSWFATEEIQPKRLLALIHERFGLGRAGEVNECIEKLDDAAQLKLCVSLLAARLFTLENQMEAVPSQPSRKRSRITKKKATSHKKRKTARKKEENVSKPSAAAQE